MPTPKDATSEVAKSTQRVGMFFCIEKQDELDSVYEFVNQIKDELGSVTALVFYLGKSKTDQHPEDIFWIDKKAFNLFGHMKSKLKNKLQKQTFDLFISFVTCDAKKCADILKFTGARLKVGPRQMQGKQIVDISLAVPNGRMDYSEFYQQLTFYMKKLKIKIQ